MVLDTVVTEALEQEGVARDLIRRIQTKRRELDLNVSDRVSMVLRSDETTVQAFQAHESMVTAETLVTSHDAMAIDGEETIDLAVAPIVS